MGRLDIQEGQRRRRIHSRFLQWPRTIQLQGRVAEGDVPVVVVVERIRRRGEVVERAEGRESWTWRGLVERVMDMRK